MRRQLLFTLPFFVCYALKSQNPEQKLSRKDERKLMDRGLFFFEEKMYPQAYNHFSKLLTGKPNNLYLKYVTAICAIHMGNKPNEALDYLNAVKAGNLKYTDIDCYYALLYHKTYAFDKCIKLADSLIQNPQTDETMRAELSRAIEYSNNGKELIKHDVNTQVSNVGGPPNSEDDEYSPVVTADEETMIFTYRGRLSKGGLRDINNRPDKYGFYNEDVYMSKKINGIWQNAVSLDSINTTGNEAALAISNDGQQLYIFKADKTNGGDIYMSRYNGDNFDLPEKLKGEINTNNWEGSITLSGDGKKVIFSSDRQGGFGGIDLYEAVKTADNTYSNVKNLGPNINTTFDEDAPFIHPDGRSLVFSSTGHNSIGAYDIFLSELNTTDSSWQKPVNVGYPINTTSDDIFYTLSASGKKGYFASSKSNGLGNKDIYMEEPVVFTKNSFLTIVKGKITENKLPYKGDLVVYTGAGDYHYATFKSNNDNGNYIISLPAGRNYKVVFTHSVHPEKVVNVAMNENVDYSELVVDINFGENDASPTMQNIVAQVRDTVVPIVPVAGIGIAEAGIGAGIIEAMSNTSSAINGGNTVTVIHANNTTNIAAQSSINLNEIASNTSLPESVSNATTLNESGRLKNLTRAELMARFGDLEIADLDYIIQVGAYRHPQNYNTSKLIKVGGVKRAGVINNNVHLFVLNQQFKTWREASNFLIKVKEIGQKDAFITANYKGKRYYVKDLIEMGVWPGNTMMATR